MTRKHLSFILMIISFSGLALALLCTAEIYYSDGPWNGRVIDVETRNRLKELSCCGHMG